MKAKICQLIKLDKSKIRIVSSEITEITENDVDRMLAQGICPISVPERTGEIIYVVDTRMNETELRAIISDVVPNSLSTKEIIVEYYEMSEDVNHLTVDDIVFAVRQGKDSEEVVDHSGLFSMIGINAQGHETFKLDYGRMVIVCSSKIIDIKAGANETIKMIYDHQEEKKHVFYNDVLVTDLESVIGLRVFEFLPNLSKSVSLKHKSVFTIVGQIDLGEYKQPKPPTIAWVNKVRDKLNLEPMHNASVESAINGIYEVLNEIAEQQSFYISNKSAYFLLPPGYARVANLSTEKTIDDMDAISIMSRRNGNIVVAGNPIFTSKTLEDSAIWLLAKIAE